MPRLSLSAASADSGSPQIGGIPAVAKYLIRNTSLLDGSTITVTGATLAENVKNAPDLDFGLQDIVRPIEKPLKEDGHITIFGGNLATGTAVGKITGKEGTAFDVRRPLLRRSCLNVSMLQGAAKCFDREDDFYPALRAGEIKAGMIVIFRYQGPKGAPGMPEM